jgi:DNA-binding SARP family transcriptional activator
VLGAFEVEGAGGPVPVSGRQRVVLAALALEANRPVPVDRLLGYAWGEESPRDVRNALQTLVARLRRRLGAALIETAGDGYLLRVPAGAVDAVRFRELVAAAGQARRDGGDPAAELGCLREALALWRGTPLYDVPSDTLRAEAVPGLREIWFTALERRLDLDLDAGRHREIIGELRDLTADYPLREELWRQLMLALYRSGRRAEALEAYRAVSRGVRGQLGLDVGRDLADLHQAILAADASLVQPATTPAQAPSAPRQLPSDLPDFTGRAADLAGLDGLAARVLEEAAGTGGQRPIVISAIDGTAGVGKTALAVHWAHRIEHLFPDGQLFLNLRGYGPERPVDPLDALEHMLRSLGVPAARVPDGVDARSALLRSELTGRRMLIVLDNARDSDHVRPLLPGGDCLVLVTSRRRLGGLSAREGARHLSVDVPPPPDAVALFAGVVGADRVAAEPAAAAALVELCARLPLAVRLAAEQAVRHPSWPLKDLLAELAGRRDRLAALALDDSADADLRTVFAWSYEALDPDAAHVFRALGLHPGCDTGVPAAAALAEFAPDRAATALARLVDASLVQERRPGRYELHDLLREYARDRADEGDPDRDAAVGRLLDWYVHTAANARGRLTRSPHRLPLPDAPPEGIVPLDFVDAGAATHWFDRERDTVVRLVDLAAAQGRHRTAAVLVQMCWIFLYLRGSRNQLLAVGRAGLRAAVAAGDAYLEGRCHTGLAGAYMRSGRPAAALVAGDRALDIFERIGDRQGQASALLGIGGARNEQGRYAEAIEPLRRAHRIWSGTGEAADEAMAATALNNLAWAYLGLGRHAEALDCAGRAVDTLRVLGETYRLVPILDTYAAVHAARGDRAAAIDAYSEALAVAEETGATGGMIAPGTALGHQLLAAGRHTEALAQWRRTYEVAVATGDHRAGELRGLLAEHGGRGG